MNTALKSVGSGILAMLILLLVYGLILTFVSGFSFMLDQFITYWFFVVSLAAGFGIQIFLYMYVRHLVYQEHLSGNVIVVSGTTSTITMVSCCTHYLVNLIPILGVTGLATFVGQYQIELFWIGIISNLLGIAYLTTRILMIKKTHG